MSKTQSQNIFYELILVIANSLGINCKDPLYKKRKGALIVDTLATYIKKNERHSYLEFLKVIRKILNESPGIRQWVNNNIERIEQAGLSEIDALSLYIELDSSDNPPYFYSLYQKKIKILIENSDIQSISDIYNFQWGISRYDNSVSNNAKLFEKERKMHYIKKLSMDALSGMEKILAESCKKNISKNEKNDGQVFVIGIGFIPGHIEATHLNYIYNVAISIKQAFKDSKIYLAVTGEPVVGSVYTGIAFDGEIISEFENFWQNVNNEKGFVYINKKSNINGFLSWIENISPDLFFSLGGVFKTEVCSRIVHDLYKLPVVFIPASNSNKITFPVDGALVTNEDMYNNYSAKVDKDRCFLLRPINKTILNNEPFLDFSIRRDDKEFIAAVVLNSNRIARWFESLNNIDLNKFVEFFETNENFKLLLIGEKDSGRIISIDNKIESLASKGRIVVLGQVKQLRGLYQHIDLVFSLPGVTGGGGAIKTALYDNVMCICWNKSDACLHIHKSFHYEDIDGLLKNLDKAISEPLYKKNNLNLNLSLQEQIEGDSNVTAWKSAIDTWVIN